MRNEYDANLAMEMGSAYIRQQAITRGVLKNEKRGLPIGWIVLAVVALAYVLG